MCHKSENFTLSIEGMRCEGCVKRIENILAKEKTVNSYDVSLDDKKVTVLLKKKADIAKIIEKIENLDFKVTIMK